MLGVVGCVTVLQSSGVCDGLWMNAVAMICLGCIQAFGADGLAVGRCLACEQSNHLYVLQWLAHFQR